MFRIGGGVDAQGTGITSGMDTPRRGLVTEPGGYAGEKDYEYWSSKVPEAFQDMRSILGATTLMKGADALRNVQSILF